MTAEAKKRVLVTGTAGVVGRAVCKALSQRGHFVRALDRAKTPENLGAAEIVVADIADGEAIHKAADSMDAILHIAANPDESSDFVNGLVRPNIIGLYNICEAARKHEIKRLVLTSTIMVSWGLPWKERVVTVDDPYAPTCHYALTKVYAEEMGRMYSRLYGMTVTAMRLGWMPRTQEQIESLESDPLNAAIYLSGDDVGRAYVCALEAPAEQVGGFAAMYITSRRDADHGADLSAAKNAIGFEPRDGYLENPSEHLRK